MNNRNFKISAFTVFTAIILFLSGCSENAWDNHLGSRLLSGKNLYEAIQAEPNLSVFASLLKKTGYDVVLQSANSYTVFAPQNSAWSGIDTTNIVLLSKKIGMLIIYNTYFSDNKELYSKITSVNGKNVFYDSVTKTFNGAKIITADIAASNGVVQITDIPVERKENIWDFVSANSTYKQSQFINSLNKRVMDATKSVAIGVYSDGKTKYDTVWKNINNFLLKYPIDNEDSTYTYVIVENSGYDFLFNKYRDYFKLSTSLKTDSATNFNVCQDFVFKGIVDITKSDTLINVDNIKVPFGGVTVKQVYNSSNGRVYIVNQSNIRLKDKIKPILIEGENYNKAYDANYVFTRYKRWASGERDIVLSGGETQADTLWHKIIVNNRVIPDYTGLRDSIRRDSVVSKTYYINSNLVANVANFQIEYKAQVNSTNYDIYYVAYDDISDHSDLTYTSFGAYRIIQKLFISMPGSPALKRGTITGGSGTTFTSGVMNNYLGNFRCFVGVGKAGINEITKLTQWDLESTNATQLVATQVSPKADVMNVPQTGTLTMWLCNTARSTTASKQGLLFLDYILLVPRITE